MFKNPDDVLLTGCGCVELAAHLGESLVELSAQVDKIAPQTDEILPHSVEARRCRLPKGQMADGDVYINLRTAESRRPI